MLTRSPSFKHQRSDIETQGRRFATACKIPQSRKQPRRKFGAGTFEVHYVEREAGSRKDGNLRVAGLRTVRLWSLAARPDRKARLAGLHTANRGRYPGVPRKPKGRRLGSGKTASKAEACIQARHHSEMTPAAPGRGFFVCLQRLHIRQNTMQGGALVEQVAVVLADHLQVLVAEQFA